MVHNPRKRSVGQEITIIVSLMTFLYAVYTKIYTEFESTLDPITHIFFLSFALIIIYYTSIMWKSFMVANVPIYIIYLCLFDAGSCQIPYNGPASKEYFYNVSINVLNLNELECGNFSGNFPTIGYLGETTLTNPVNYYKLNITSEMLSTWTLSMNLKTCCGYNMCKVAAVLGEMPYEECSKMLFNTFTENINTSTYETIDNTSYTRHCGIGSSLPTFIYLLYEQRGRLNLVDTSRGNGVLCYNQEKSIIDLTKYPEGEYIVGVGGYANQYGSYWIQMQCEQYSWLLSIEEIAPDRNMQGVLNCGEKINGSLSLTQQVAYFKFEITDNTYFPILIDQCAGVSLYDDVWQGFYMVRKTGSGNSFHMLNTPFDFTNYTEQVSKYWDGYWGYTCNERNHTDMYPYFLILEDREQYKNGEYYVVVQAPMNRPEYLRPFALRTMCAPPPEKMPETVLLLAVFGTCGILLLSFMIYYINRWKKHTKSKPQSILIPTDENDELQTSKTSTHILSHQYVNSNSSINKPDIEMIPINELNINNKEKMEFKYGRIDGDKDIVDQLKPNYDDVVQLVLAHAIQCCEDQSGLDIYQVLSMRYYDEESQTVRGIKPFKRCGCHVEFISISPFVKTLLIAIVAALAQTMGISIVIYKLFVSYFSDGITEDLCPMLKSRWNAVYSLKILSFLLSLIITFHISIQIDKMQHSGLYEIMSRLKLQHILRINREKHENNNSNNRKIVLWLLYLGQGINNYVCLFAVIGSYFIIFQSNKGDEQDDGSVDYSQSGLDMILNAVALFFMLEIDDVNVSPQDYIDCKEHLICLLQNYKPDEAINARYIQDENSQDTCYGHCFGVNGCCKRSSCCKEKELNGVRRLSMPEIMDYTASCCTKFIYEAITIFSVLVKVCCYVGGFVAPFFIFFCW
eukprot:301707_1